MHLEILIILLWLIAAACLGCGLFYLAFAQSRAGRQLNILSWSLLFIACVLIFLLIAFSLGWIVPYNL